MKNPYNLMGKNAIPDTNIFLHYDILSVDWCKELESDELEIIVCPTVLNELDKKKYDVNRVISERATRNLSIIESHHESHNEIRKNVKITVMTREPKIDWDSFSLDSNLNDDRILGFMVERNNQDDVLITNDSTPRIKGKLLGITIGKLKCEMLPPAKSEERKELEKVQKELLAFQNRIPDLSLELISSETSENGLPKFSIKTNYDLSNEQIENMVSEREQELNFSFTTFPFAISALMVDQQRYKSDVKKYLDLYRKYIVDKNPIDKELSTILKMGFVLSCEKAPAEDIHCHIEFPKDFQILEESDLPETPSEPPKPKPMSPIERSVFGLNLDRLSSFGPHIFNVPKHIPERIVNVNIDSNVIRATVKKINHGLEIEICTVYVKLPSLESAKNFEVFYSIHAPNLIEPIKKKIPIIIEKIEEIL